ncbi:hypothetical protein PAXRUDRAFT_826234 [Paxillus rubicundulus Ve08.2h10]|uniref:Uncharacterized protein n=1 Tax=Paxillus rubicundulus Ve08.2h10 TaxID=930991 RepID=A0A0D0DEZ8_9AGAM|nr:hypothetical protein PAXRUDRAFT_826234 [Paxillus rubicundulus Ve08.2h10]
MLCVRVITSNVKGPENGANVSDPTDDEAHSNQCPRDDSFRKSGMQAKQTHSHPKESMGMMHHD